MRHVVLFPLALLCFAAPAFAATRLPDTPMERVEIFATCAGRLDALRTRQAARHDARVQETTDLRDEFDLLTDAMLPYGDDETVAEATLQAKRWRHRGWSEISTHFGDIDYSINLKRARRAEVGLDAKIAVCTRLLLSAD
ncbi:hypothetical protein [Chachezhania antarctica]|uniref:hypothetical protein n=1 Tax=Chachezhania antarctica TaxID=2340860 RepID=UPI0013CE93A8|nr:hypothetical protein [Chachezhania antarctica]|tara:strand:+ start:329 stop:748 length:420 start_codon:yes stop_codon:yes gene_type:complete